MLKHLILRSNKTGAVLTILKAEPRKGLQFSFVRSFASSNAAVARPRRKIKDDDVLQTSQIIEATSENLSSVESVPLSVETITSVQNGVEKSVGPKVDDLIQLLPRLLQKSLQANGIEKLFEVQEETIKVYRDTLLNKDIESDAKRYPDLTMRAKTGTGKTIAFGIPMITRILQAKDEMQKSRVPASENIGRPLGVVIAPTRELAIQVHSELEKLAMGHLHGAVVYGGAPYDSQLRKITDKRNPIDFLVGTPGRTMDLLSKNEVMKFDQVKVFILDEADEMLKIGFREELEAMAQMMPNKEERMNLMFSATFSDEVMQVARQFMKKDEKLIKRINLVKDSESKIPDNILFEKMYVARYQNFAQVLGPYLVANLGSKDPSKTGRAIVFANTKLECENLLTSKEIGSYLQESAGLTCASLHGDMNQGAREAALEKFRDRKVSVIFATDVAARGLDIPAVDLVVHFGLPLASDAAFLDAFIHRSGRTGRAGRSGKNLVLFSSNAYSKIAELENHTKRKFRQVLPPTKEDILVHQLNSTTDDIIGYKPTSYTPLFQNVAKDLIAKKDISFENNSELEAKIQSLIATSLEIGLSPSKRGGSSKDRSSYSVITGEEGAVSYLCKMPSEIDNSAQIRNARDIAERYFLPKLNDILKTYLKGGKGTSIIKAFALAEGGSQDGVVFDVPQSISDNIESNRQAVDLSSPNAIKITRLTGGVEIPSLAPRSLTKFADDSNRYSQSSTNYRQNQKGSGGSNNRGNFAGSNNRSSRPWDSRKHSDDFTAQLDKREPSRYGNKNKGPQHRVGQNGRSNPKSSYDDNFKTSSRGRHSNSSSDRFSQSKRGERSNSGGDSF